MFNSKIFSWIKIAWIKIKIGKIHFLNYNTFRRKITLKNCHKKKVNKTYNKKEENKLVILNQSIRTICIYKYATIALLSTIF